MWGTLSNSGRLRDRRRLKCFRLVTGRGSTTKYVRGAVKSASLFAPHAREPGLPLWWQSGRPVIVSQFNKPRGRHEMAPGFEIVIRAVAPAAPAFLVMTVRIRA